MSVEGHKRQARKRVGFGILTVSDTRDRVSDAGGDRLAELVEGAGHVLLWRSLVRDEPAEILAETRRGLALEELEILLVTGGTGIAPRDVTIPTLAGEFDAEIPGFGELFRWLSYRDIGSATILSRACAGVIGGRIVFCLPGSPKALSLAMQEIILPEAGHLVSQVTS